MAALLIVLLALGVVLLARRAPQPMGRKIGGIALIAAALALVAFRQIWVAAPVGLLGLGLLRDGLGAARAARQSGRRSEVRTAALVMGLDHDDGAMDGEILTGRFEGLKLSQLDDADLDALAAELTRDPDSLGLLLAYIERLRGPQDGDPPPSAAGGEMTEAEAYRILGLAPGAGAAEIREAHRRLIKKLHPDLGGTDALAGLINAAKARLEP